MIDESRIMPPISEMLAAWREHTNTPVHVPEGCDTIEPTTTKGPPMNDIATQAVLMTVHDELDADTVSAMGLDPTGRDGNPLFPYTVGKLALPQLLLLQALANQDAHYPNDEMPEAEGCALWYDVANAEVEHRLGEEATEHYYAWSTDNRMTAEELINQLKGTSSLDHVLRVIAGE